jgi:hypothetical protein
MGFWSDQIISIPKVTFRRFCWLAEELYYLTYDEELSGSEARDEAEKIIINVLDEYVRQHFEESTKLAVNLLRKHPDDRSPLQLL